MLVVVVVVVCSSYISSVPCIISKLHTHMVLSSNKQCTKLTVHSTDLQKTSSALAHCNADQRRYFALHEVSDKLSGHPTLSLPSRAETDYESSVKYNTTILSHVCHWMTEVYDSGEL